MGFVGDVIGGVTDAIGLTDHKGQEAAQRRADANAERSFDLSDKQIEFAREQLQFQKSQYQDWKNIYGDIQENLGDYYKNLDAEKLTVLGLENQQREFQAAVKQIERNAAQRGIEGSGLEYNAIDTATFANAEARARIRTNAEQEVAEQQLGFLGVGLGQGTQMLGIINNESRNVNSAYGQGVAGASNLANSYLNQSTQISLMNQQVTGELFGTAIGFASGG